MIIVPSPHLDRLDDGCRRVDPDLFVITLRRDHIWQLGRAPIPHNVIAKTRACLLHKSNERVVEKQPFWLRELKVRFLPHTLIVGQVV